MSQRNAPDYRGDLTVSLAYTAATQRLSVTVHHARHLKTADVIGGSDPYVKIWLHYNGKRVEKKKTSVVEKSLNPDFDETFTFTISNEKLRKAHLHFFVMDYDRVSRNDFLGEMILGAAVNTGSLEGQHWREMLAKNGKLSTRTHPLKPKQT